MVWQQWWPEGGLHAPLADAPSARASVTISFSIMQDGTTLSVSGLEERVNLSIPFAVTPRWQDPDDLLSIECRWYDTAAGNWSTAGCLTIVNSTSSVTCSGRGSGQREGWMLST